MNPEDPSIAQLRVLRALDAAGSYAAAAAEAGTERAQLWQQVRRLESYVSGQDAERTVRLARRGQLTTAGRQLLAAADQILDSVDRFRGVVDDLRRAPDSVQLAAFPAHAVLVTMAAGALATARVPVTLTMTAMSDDDRRRGGSDLLRRLHEGLADLVICSPPAEATNKGVTTTPLYSWDLAAIVSTTSPLFGQETVELEAVIRTRVMMSPRGHLSRGLLEEPGIPLRPIFESESVDALYTLAISDWATALIPGDAVPVSRAAAELQAGWPKVVCNGRPVGGGYVAAFASNSHRASAVKRVASALSNVVRPWAKGARFIHPAAR